MSGKGISLFHSLWKKVGNKIKPVSSDWDVEIPSNLNLKDNDELNFGDDEDADIVWDGSDFVLDYDTQNAGTSSFKVQKNGSDVFVGDSSGVFDVSDRVNMSTSGPILIGTDHGLSVGDESVAIGKGARALEDTGETIAGNHPRSTVVGFGAGNNTGSGVFGLTALGYISGENNTGDRVTALGYASARNNTGGRVTAVGYSSGRNSTGDRLTAVGYFSGNNNTGDRVTAVGYFSGESNTANDITALGYYSARNNTGGEIVAIGENSVRGDGVSSVSNMGTNVTAIGFNSLRDNTGDNAVAVGYDAGKSNTGNDSVLVGKGAGENNSDNNQFIVAQTNVNTESLIQGDFSTGVVDFLVKGLVARSTDPTDPSTNQSVMWQTDGSSGTAGADGDIMMKVTDSSGTTKTVTLVDFSAN